MLCIDGLAHGLVSVSHVLGVSPSVARVPSKATPWCRVDSASGPGALKGCRHLSAWFVTVKHLNGTALCQVACSRVMAVIWPFVCSLIQQTLTSLLCARPGFDLNVGQTTCEVVGTGGLLWKQREHLPIPLYKQWGIWSRPSGSGPNSHQLGSLESQVVFLEWK